MYVEEAAWLRQTLAALELPPAPDVINIGSSTEHYRTVEQPHNELDVLAPLRARGAAITHLDVKHAAGVDLAVDLTDPKLDLRAVGGAYDLVLATGLLGHVDPAAIPRLVAQLRNVTRPGGLLVLTVPESYRRTLDPVDYGFRPSVADLGELVCQDGFAAVAADSVRIDDPRYYKGFLSRPSRVPIGGRWIPLPGASEQIRRRVRRWRWRESCLVAAAPADA